MDLNTTEEIWATGLGAATKHKKKKKKRFFWTWRLKFTINVFRSKFTVLDIPRSMIYYTVPEQHLITRTKGTSNVPQ
jgi:hypothetical protein